MALTFFLSNLYFPIFLMFIMLRLICEKKKTLAVKNKLPLGVLMQCICSIICSKCDVKYTQHHVPFYLNF